MRPPSPEHLLPELRPGTAPGGVPGAPRSVAIGTQRPTDHEFTRCASPTLTARKTSTYTVLGFAGYVIASLTGAALSVAWNLTLGERLIGLLIPPIAFLIAVTTASAIVRRERIVFYQTAIAGVVATAVVSGIAGVRVARLVDLATLGIGTFLVFGRIGCFAVACCHGALGRGVVYGPAHVRAGFWARWEGRALWPVQLFESAASAVLVIAGVIAGAIAGWMPGSAAILYIVGYAVVRFALELVRGDAVRPFWRGVSEAQWLALASAIACAVWRPHPAVIGAAAALAVAALVLARRADRRELFLPPHLHELDAVCNRVLADPGHARRETSRGVALSCYAMPDGRLDWVMSSSHPVWSTAAARRLAIALWREHEIVEGRAPGVIHVVVPAGGSTGAVTGTAVAMREDDPRLN